MKEKNFNLFEIHQWNNDRLPFIYHLDVVSRPLSSEYSNWHENIEILYVIEGDGTILCDSVEYQASAGDFFIINCENIHSTSSKNKFTYHCLIVDTNFCLENGLNIKNIVYKTQIKDKKLEELFNVFVREYNETTSDLKVPAVRAAVLQIMLHISRNHVSESNDRLHQRSSEIIHKALNFINSNYEKKLTLETVAKNINVSKFYFEREFKKYTGYTVITYVNMLRCRQAKRLLKHSDNSISEIAKECGFENMSYFSRTFYKYENILPSDYKKSQKNP